MNYLHTEKMININKLTGIKTKLQYYVVERELEFSDWESQEELQAEINNYICNIDNYEELQLYYLDTKGWANDAGLRNHLFDFLQDCVRAQYDFRRKLATIHVTIDEDNEYRVSSITKIDLLNCLHEVLIRFCDMEFKEINSMATDEEILGYLTQKSIDYTTICSIVQEGVGCIFTFGD